MKLKHYLFACLALLGFVSCSEEDDTVVEYADWQSKNEAYFETQYQQHLAASSATSFVLKSYTKGDTLTLDQLAHTDCILVDVLPADFKAGEDKTATPIFTDLVSMYYRGRLLPSPSYPQGYQFDSSYYGTSFYEDVSEPVALSVNGLIVGMTTALQHMHRGDHWRVTIPHQLGYGASAMTGIPAYSTLVFDIRLVDFGPED